MARKDPARKKDYEPIPLSSPTPGYGELVRVGMKLPLAYLEILDREASYFNYKRNQFLEMMLLRRMGRLSVKLERSPEAPKRYEFDLAKFQDVKMWPWYMKPEMKRLLDEDRLTMGRYNPQDWVGNVVREWIGHTPVLKR